MPEINLVDPALKNYYDNSEISIQVSLDGFSFCINSDHDKQIRAFRHYRFTNTILQEDILNHTEEILHKDELLRLPFKKVRVMLLNRKSTIVPENFVVDAKLNQILEFNQPIDELDEVHHNPLPASGAKIVFTVPTYFAGLMAERFKTVRFYNHATPLLASCIKDTAHPTGIYIQLNTGFFDLALIKDNKLKLYNTFVYVDSTDLLYFILFACKQLAFDLKGTPAFILGEQAGNQKLLGGIKSYISSLNPVSLSDRNILSDDLRSLDQIRFYSLLNLLVCE